jgi:catechol 2,3-dioxygenase-like lactoylglutathione lyase family enzyme
MAEFRKIVPVLQVSDLQRSVAFYTGILGFTVAWRAANDGGGENCLLQAGAADLLLRPLPSRRQAAVRRHAVLQHGRGAGVLRGIKDQVEIVWPLETITYGQKEFGIRECDGYTLAFAEPLENDAGGRQ